MNTLKTLARTFSYSKKDIDDALAGAATRRHSDLDEYFRDAADRLIRCSHLGDMEETGTKKVEDFYPFFSSFELPTFAKIYLADEMLWLSSSDVSTIRVTGLDKYMLSFLDYYDVEYTGRVVDNIPVGLSGDSLAIAKAIVGNRLSNKEAKIVSDYMEMVKKYSSLYAEYKGVVDCAIDGTTACFDKDYFYETLAKARATGWFANCPDPSGEEINHFVGSNPVISLPEYKDETPADTSPKSSAKKSKDSAKKKAPVIIEIGMKDLENAADMISANITPEVLTEICANEPESAGFSVSTLISAITGIGKNVATALPGAVGILSPLISAGIDIAKEKIIDEARTNPDKVVKIVEKVPTNVIIRFDKTIDAAGKFGDFLKDGLEKITKLIKAETDKDRIAAIEDICEFLKSSIDVLDSDAAKNLIGRLLVNISNPVVTSVDNEAAANSTDKVEAASGKEENKVIDVLVPVDVDTEPEPVAMSLTDVLRSISPEEKTETPDVIKRVMEDNTRPVSDKEKPAFIVETNMVSTTPETKPATPAPQVSHKIETTISEQYPWLRSIADIASKYGVSLEMAPVYNPSLDGKGNIITSIRVVASVNGVFSHLKSFTIDLGFCMDSRVKLFANCSANGFGYCEREEESFFVFKNDQKTLYNKVFELIFNTGFTGIQENVRKEIRMYNKNSMMLNRKIIMLSVPTDKVRGNDRQALKDSVFKMRAFIRKMEKNNGDMSLGRFYIRAFDAETMTYTLTNRDSYLYGQLCNAPTMVLRVTIVKENGKVVYVDKQPRLQVELIYFDEIPGFVYPEEFKDVIEPAPDNTPDIEDDDDESTTPEVIVVPESDVIVEEAKAEASESDVPGTERAESSTSKKSKK